MPSKQPPPLISPTTIPTAPSKKKKENYKGKVKKKSAWLAKKIASACPKEDKSDADSDTHSHTPFFLAQTAVMGTAFWE